MSPPIFKDIGKSVNDLLNKDYPVGFSKLEVKTTASNGVNFTVSGNQDSKSKSIAGELKTKYTDKGKGLTLTETWSSANVVGLEAELADSLVKGLKLTFNGSILPSSGGKQTKVGFEMKQERFNSTASIDVFKGPIVTADAVLGLDRLTLGGEVSYSLNDGKLAKYNAALGYSAQDYVVSLHALSSFNEFSASYYHRVNADLEAGAKATWDRKYSNGTVNIEVGSKYNLDRETFVKSKINNLGIFSLGYTQELRKGFKTTLAGSLDTAKLDSLRLGVSFAYEA